MVEVARPAAGPKIREWSRKHGFSDWMVARFVHLVAASDMPEGATARFLEGVRRRPPRYLRVNTLKVSRSELQKRLHAKGFHTSNVDLDPDVVKVEHAPLSPGATMEHLLGMTSMQDLASAAAPLALGLRRGDVVADLAAAPGIKTVHMAGLMQDEGTIVAVEPSEERMRALRFNLERSGVTSVIRRQHRAQETPGEAWADRVLLDAPCSGEGTIPKDSDRRRGHIEDIQKMVAEQDDILVTADRILKPGGTLVYATCTFAPEENERHVQRLIERGYKVERLPFDSCGGVRLGRGVTTWPGLELDQSIRETRRFFPGLHPTLGFYVARLRKGEA